MPLQKGMKGNRRIKEIKEEGYNEQKRIYHYQKKVLGKIEKTKKSGSSSLLIMIRK